MSSAPIGTQYPPNEMHFCHKCNRRTHWSLLYRGARERCDECHDLFPCVHECKHLDCARHRKERRVR